MSRESVTVVRSVMLSLIVLVAIARVRVGAASSSGPWRAGYGPFIDAPEAFFEARWRAGKEVR